MVQILEARSSPWDLLTKGVPEALGTIADTYSQHKQSKALNEFAAKSGIDPTLFKLVAKQDPAKAMQMVMAAQLIRGDAGNQADRQGQQQGFISPLVQDELSQNFTPEGLPMEGGESGYPQGLQQAMQQGQRAPQQQIAQGRKPPYSKQQIQGAMLMGNEPLASNMLRSNEIAERHEEKTLTREEGKKEFGHNKTEKFDIDLTESYNSALQMKQALKSVERALKSGKTGTNLRNIVYAELKAANSPLAGVFQSENAAEMELGKKNLAGGFRELFGSRPTQAEFFWYETILPDLLKEVSTNVAIAKYFDDVANMSIKRRQIADNITKKNGGYRPIDIDSQIREKMEPELKKIIQTGQHLYSKGVRPISKDFQSKARPSLEELGL